MKKFSGFTLLEILITLFILTIVGMLISSGLSSIVKAKDQMDVKYNELIHVQIAMALMERDIRQMINRSVLDGGRKMPSVILLNNKIEFTHVGYMNPFAIFQRSILQRVSYGVEGGNLIRQTWSEVDRLPGRKAHHEVLLSHIKNFHIKMIPMNNPFLNPDMLDLSVKGMNFNVGIEVEMESQQLGYIKRIIPISINHFYKEIHVTGKPNV